MRFATSVVMHTLGTAAKALFKFASVPPAAVTFAKLSPYRRSWVSWRERSGRKSKSSGGIRGLVNDVIHKQVGLRVDVGRFPPLPKGKSTDHFGAGDRYRTRVNDARITRGPCTIGCVANCGPGSCCANREIKRCAVATAPLTEVCVGYKALHRRRIRKARSRHFHIADVAFRIGTAVADVAALWRKGGETP